MQFGIILKKIFMRVWEEVILRLTIFPSNIAPILLFFVIFATSCASIPIEQLREYASAYQQARNAGDLLLDEVSPIISGVVSGGSSKQACRTNNQGYPTCFDPRQALGRQGLRANEDVSIRVRRAALEAIAIYNSILLDLAEGKSVEALSGRIDGLAQLAGVVGQLGSVAGPAFPALIGPTAGFAKDITGRLEQGRANQQVRSALIESKSSVQGLLGLLENDTPYLFKIFLSNQQIRLVRASATLRRAQLNKSGVADAQKKLDGIKNAINSYHSSLASYVQLLSQTSKSLDVLVVAVQTTTFTTANLSALISEAAKIRQISDEFWKNIRKVREAQAVAA